MKIIPLGFTGLSAPQNGFGCLPIQRIGHEAAAKLLRRAYDGGMRFFDTARGYSDSEEKIGLAFGGKQSDIIYATKTTAQTPEGFWHDLNTSLQLLKVPCVDIYQFHCADRCYRPNDGSGMYEAMLEAKAQGKIHHIGITTHRIGVAEEAIASGLYETLQFPFSYLSNERELGLAAACKTQNMLLIAMKALAGGLITNAKAAFAFLSQFDNVMPIWGIQRETELDDWLGFFENPAEMTDELRIFIEKEREELTGNFCRGCGYCMPCPMGIEINNCARMSLMLRRAPSEAWLTDLWQERMRQITACLSCGKCKSKCPYGLDVPNLLRANLEDYQAVLDGKISVRS